MDTLQIKILNPKAEILLRNLADLELIEITDPKKEFLELLDRLQSNADNAPTLEEITKEVEIVRKERYEKEKNNS